MYVAYEENDDLTWDELIRDSDSFSDLWDLYRTTSEDEEVSAQVQRYFEKRNIELAEKRKEEKDLQERIIAEKNKDVEIVTNIID